MKQVRLLQCKKGKRKTTRERKTTLGKIKGACERAMLISPGPPVGTRRRIPSNRGCTNAF